MKILIIDHYYPRFLEELYKTNSEISHKGYASQKELILRQCFGTADFYSKNFKKLGHTAEEIICNNAILQKKWLKENKIRFLKTSLKNFFSGCVNLKNLELILAAQIEEFSPDILYCQNLNFPRPNFLRKMKKKVKNIIGQIACPIVFDKKELEVFDLIITSFPHFVKKFKNIGINSEYLKLGFEDSILERLNKREKRFDAVFIGGISKHHFAFIEILEYLAKNIKIDFWGYGFEKLHKDSPILSNYHGEAWGMEMYNILHNSKISINRHIDAAENFANNMRLYESTGVGTMLITDYKNNINSLFEVGEEIETYKSKEELLGKIKYYLANEEKRKKIAELGQKRTLKDHTYAKRIDELVKIINQYSGII